MGYRPQFEHKTGQPQGHVAAGALGDDDGGLAIIKCLAIWGVFITANEACDQAQDGTT
jgi:hypothetical protein